MTTEIAVYGATGHTGRFVIAELSRRGYAPVAVGRDAARLAALAALGATTTHVADIEEPASLVQAFQGAAAVINCAGPFLDTGAPVIDAALRAGAHYLDVNAEQRSTLDTFEKFGTAARERGRVVLPAMAFYGGLPDLLASALCADGESVDEIRVVIALDRWWPTEGTRRTGARNTFPRQVVEGGRLVPLASPAPSARLTLPPPFGEQDVIALPFSEIVTLSSHLRATAIHTFINTAPLQDLRNPDTPPPAATDERGRSAQQFLLEVTVTRNGETRIASARGRDIYASTAPLVVEAVTRILDGRARTTGVASAGGLFEARDFLSELAGDITVEYR